MKTTPDLKEFIHSEMKEAFDRHHGHYRQYYATSARELRTKQSKTHAVIMSMLSVGNNVGWQRGVVKALHDELRTTFFMKAEYLRPRTQDYEAFRNWITKIKNQNDVSATVVKYLEKKVRGSEQRRAPDITRDLLLKYYIDCRTLNHKRIAEEINKELRLSGYDITVSRYWVKKWIDRDNLKSLGVVHREGVSAHRSKVTTPQLHAKPNYALSQVQIDGSSIQLIENLIDENGKQIPYHPNYFIVVESRSGKIIGYSIDFSENSWMILRALEMSVKTTGCLPAEMLSDNSSAYHKDIFKGFLNRASILGMVYNRSHSRNPQRQSIVESANQRLQSLAKQHDRFAVGQSPRTKKRKPDEVVKTLGLRQYRLTRQEVEKRVGFWVEIYNSTPYESGHQFAGLSPNEVFERSEKKHAIRVSPFEIPVLFHKQTKCKVVRGLVTITVNKEKFSFELNSPEEKDRFFGKAVNVYYDVEDLSEVTITDEETESDIVVCKRQKMHQVAQVEQTEEDIATLEERLRRTKEEADFRMQRILKAVHVENATHTKSEAKLAEIHRLYQLQNDDLVVRRMNLKEVESAELEVVLQPTKANEDESVLQVVRKLSRWDD